MTQADPLFLLLMSDSATNVAHVAIWTVDVRFSD